MLRNSCADYIEEVVSEWRRSSAGTTSANEFEIPVARVAMPAGLGKFLIWNSTNTFTPRRP
jgi:hypothetical protein